MNTKPTRNQEKREEEVKNPEEHPGKLQGKKNRRQNKWKRMTLANKWIVGFTGVIAVCTLVYAIVSAFQLGALIESNSLSRVSLQSVQRGYVSFQRFNIVMLTKRISGQEQSYIRFSAETLNGGNTPAVVVAQYFEINNPSAEPTGKTFIGTPIKLNDSIGPKVSHSIGPVDRAVSSFGINLSSRPIQTHESPENVFLWGYVVYKDVFPETKIHLTEFCQWLRAIDFNPKGQPLLNFEYQGCIAHNCTDEQCDDYGEIVAIASK